MNDTTETVVLKSGIEMPKPLVLATWATLRSLMERAPMVLFDAVQMARTGEPQFNAAQLEKIGLTQDGQMHDGIRDIILSAALGDGLDLRLTSPVA